MASLAYQHQGLTEPILMILAVLSWECDFLIEIAKIVQLTLTKGFLVLHCLDQLVTQDVALCMLTTSERFHFYRLTKDGKHIKTTHWQTNSYQLGQVGEQDIYDEDWLKKPPTLVQEIAVAVDGEDSMVRT